MTTKDPKEVAVGKRLAEYNRKKRGEQKIEAQKSKVEPMLTSIQYSIGAVLAVGVIGGLGYYLYQARKGEVNAMPPQPCTPHPQTNKFEME